MKIKILLIFLVGCTLFFFQNCSSHISALSQGMNINDKSFLAVKDVKLDELQKDCPEPEYHNFKCLSKTLRTQEGLDYAVTFRWNRAEQDSDGTVIWILGGNGQGQWHTLFKESIAIQDDFDQNKKIRSVEVEFTDSSKNSNDSGGYWTHGGGYYSAAQAYMAALTYIVANLKSGAFLNHVGGSNGTMVAAYALSHFGAGQFVDRFILHAGPFLPDLPEACNVNSAASFSKSPSMYGTIMSFIGAWMYQDPNKNVCSDMSSKVVSRLSVLKDAVKFYPQNAIHVVMGAKEKSDGFGDWILESNFSWYSQVDAAEKTRDIVASIGHEMYWPSVANYAARPKPLVRTLVSTPQPATPTPAPSPAPAPAPQPIPMSKPPTTQIIGFIDSVLGNTSVTISGWACEKSIAQSISVHLYLGGPAGSGTFIGGYSANQSSEPGVASSCGVSSGAYRFTITLPQSVASQNVGKPVYIHGISTTGGANLTIDRSGQLVIPQQATAATSVTTSNYSAPSSQPVAQQPISEGMFMVGPAIYYSNGSHYCYYPNMTVFTQLTGRTSGDGIRQFSSIPSSMVLDGNCGG